MSSLGIDYGLGTTNIDLKTGIRYGVIHQDEVLQAWADSSEPVYHTCEDKECNDDEDCEYCDPLYFTFEKEGYLTEQTQDDPDIFITKSPFYTYCAYCSPCAPGAGYLMDPKDKKTGIRSYCFGHDWFESGRAPYDVYRVSDDKLVLPEKEG